eukprot:m51a1_g9952 hypothetical protein (1022) ;mRNA; f:29741-36575
MAFGAFAFAIVVCVVALAAGAVVCCLCGIPMLVVASVIAAAASASACVAAAGVLLAYVVPHVAGVALAALAVFLVLHVLSAAAPGPRPSFPQSAAAGVDGRGPGGLQRAEAADSAAARAMTAPERIAAAARVSRLEQRQVMRPNPKNLPPWWSRRVPSVSLRRLDWFPPAGPSSAGAMRCPRAEPEPEPEPQLPRPSEEEKYLNALIAAELCRRRPMPTVAASQREPSLWQPIRSAAKPPASRAVPSVSPIGPSRSAAQAAAVEQPELPAALNTKPMKSLRVPEKVDAVPVRSPEAPRSARFAVDQPATAAKVPVPVGAAAGAARAAKTVVELPQPSDLAPKRVLGKKGRLEPVVEKPPVVKLPTLTAAERRLKNREAALARAAKRAQAQQTDLAAAAGTEALHEKPEDAQPAPQPQQPKTPHKPAQASPEPAAQIPMSQQSQQQPAETEALDEQQKPQPSAGAVVVVPLPTRPRMSAALAGEEEEIPRAPSGAPETEARLLAKPFSSPQGELASGAAAASPRAAAPTQSPTLRDENKAARQAEAITEPRAVAASPKASGAAVADEGPTAASSLVSEAANALALLSSSQTPRRAPAVGPQVGDVLQRAQEAAVPAVPSSSYWSSVAAAVVPSWEVGRVAQEPQWPGADNFEGLEDVAMVAEALNLQSFLPRRAAVPNAAVPTEQAASAPQPAPAPSVALAAQAPQPGQAPAPSAPAPAHWAEPPVAEDAPMWPADVLEEAQRTAEAADALALLSAAPPGPGLSFLTPGAVAGQAPQASASPVVGLAPQAGEQVGHEEHLVPPEAWPCIEGPSTGMTSSVAPASEQITAPQLTAMERFEPQDTTSSPVGACEERLDSFLESLWGTVAQQPLAVFSPQHIPEEEEPGVWAQEYVAAAGSPRPPTPEALSGESRSPSPSPAPPDAAAAPTEHEGSTRAQARRTWRRMQRQTGPPASPTGLGAEQAPQQDSEPESVLEFLVETRGTNRLLGAREVVLTDALSKCTSVWTQVVSSLAQLYCLQSLV